MNPESKPTITVDKVLSGYEMQKLAKSIIGTYTGRIYFKMKNDANDKRHRLHAVPNYHILGELNA